MALMDTSVRLAFGFTSHWHIMSCVTAGQQRLSSAYTESQQTP